MLSCAKLEHQVNLKIYYRKGSTKEIASLPSLGPVHAHLQYLLMQVAEHEVTNADCELGEGYRMVFSFSLFKAISAGQGNDAGTIEQTRLVN